MTDFGFDVLPHEDLDFGWTPNPTIPERVRVTLGDVEFASRYVYPRGGVILVLTSMEGWWEAAEPTTETFNAFTGHGVVAGMEKFGPRTITLSVLIASGPEEYWRVDQEVERLGRLRSTTLYVDEEHAGVAREADVRVVQMRTDRPHPSMARVTVTCQADDPLRYSSDSMALTAATTLDNPGDMIAYPLIDLVGPHRALTITGNGGVTTVVATPSGTARTVDLRHGVVWQGSTRVAGALSGRLVSVPPGGTSWTVTGLGSGTATVRRFEAWS